MNDITANFLFAHAFELRLLVAVAVLPVSYAAIQIALFIGRAAESILSKFNSAGANSVSTGAYSAAGAR
ncbi:MAG: hypothetical protein H6R17_1667 [Proteobacteria bacterium]|nr:hypothetical protein [Pseudomonadota bacterium]